MFLCAFSKQESRQPDQTDYLDRNDAGLSLTDLPADLTRISLDQGCCYNKSYHRQWGGFATFKRSVSERSQQVRSRISTCGLMTAVVVIWGATANAQVYGNPSAGAAAQWSAMRRTMIAACTNKAPGAPCSFSRKGQSVKGTCRAARRAGQLICHSSMRRRGAASNPPGGGMPGGNAP